MTCDYIRDTGGGAGRGGQVRHGGDPGDLAARQDPVVAGGGLLLD